MLSSQDLIKKYGNQPLPSASQGFSLGKTIQNIPGSAANFIGGIAGAVIHPLDTATNIARIGVGGVEKLIPGTQKEEKSFDSLINFYKNRYGSVDNFLQSLQNDPVGVAADASILLTGAASAVGKVGQLSKLGVVSDIGRGLSRLGEVSNPISAFGNLTAKTQSLFSSFAKAIEKSNLHISPSVKVTLGNKMNEVVDYLSKLKITGSPETRLDKVAVIVENTENTLQTFLKQIPDKYGAYRDSVIKGIQQLKGQFQNERDVVEINKQIDGAVNVLKRQPEIIPYKNLNVLKRSTFKNAFNKAGSKVLDDVEFAIGDALYDKIKTGLKGLKVNGLPIESFNENYAKLLQSQKLLKAAVGKRQASWITERVIGYLAGHALSGTPIGGLVGVGLSGALSESLPITATKSLIGSGLNSLSNVSAPSLLKSSVQPATIIQRLNNQNAQ